MGTIAFEKPFSNPPLILCTVEKGSEVRDPEITCGVDKITITGASISVQDPKGGIANIAYKVNWIAIGN